MADYKKSPNAPTKTSTAKVTIPKPKGNPLVPKGRTYLFQLPYETSWLERMGAQSKLESIGVWDQIPADVRQAVNDGAPITAPMLNRIPTPAWAKIAQELGLEWK